MVVSSFAEILLKRERAIILSCIALICAAGWYFLYSGAGTGMNTLAMTTWSFPPPLHIQTSVEFWSLRYWGVMLVMWWVMMVAMMLPSATPVILLYARVYRHHQKADVGQSLVPTGAFLLGYLLAWLLFSVLATVMQWGFERLGLVHSMLMWSTSLDLSAWFLLAAGVYQLSPLKHSCLRHCRSPAAFLAENWRNGQWGALRLGMYHGAYCVGCCVFLMLLLFVGGIMNLVWIVGLAILVLLEKLLPRGLWFARGSGACLLLTGATLLISA